MVGLVRRFSLFYGFVWWLLFMYWRPSATLDRRLKKRWSVLADDEELKNSFFSHIVEVVNCSVSLSAYQGQGLATARWLLYCLRFRI